MHSVRYEGYKFLKNLYYLFAPAIYILMLENRICSPVSYSRMCVILVLQSIFFLVAFVSYALRMCIFIVIIFVFVSWYVEKGTAFTVYRRNIESFRVFYSLAFIYGTLCTSICMKNGRTTF